MFAPSTGRLDLNKTSWARGERSAEQADKQSDGEQPKGNRFKLMFYSCSCACTTFIRLLFN